MIHFLLEIPHSLSFTGISEKEIQRAFSGNKLFFIFNTKSEVIKNNTEVREKISRILHSVKKPFMDALEKLDFELIDRIYPEKGNLKIKHSTQEKEFKLTPFKLRLLVPTGLLNKIQKDILLKTFLDKNIQLLILEKKYYIYQDFLSKGLYDLVLFPWNIYQARGSDLFEFFYSLNQPYCFYAESGFDRLFMESVRHSASASGLEAMEKFLIENNIILPVAEFYFTWAYSNLITGVLRNNAGVDPDLYFTRFK